MGGDVAALERAVEWLRPLVENRMWDYCVIWKLGDDPSRFIEWGTCCCSGGKRVENLKIKDENSEVCKDKLIKHQVRSKACRVLARLPSDIPLYSGIHGDVVISKQPRWVVHDGASALSGETSGTQVLIPVAFGLIELYSTKLVPKDQKTIDCISARYEISVKQENMPEEIDNHFRLREQTPPPLLHSLDFLPPVPHPNNYSSFDGSSTCSSLSNENQSLKIGHDHCLGGMSHENSVRKCAPSPRNILKLKRKRDTDFGLGCGYEKASMKIKQKAEKKGPYRSKNLMTERNRRQRIKDGMLTLRAIVPKISKMDRTATLGDAADYIKELVETIKNYHDELRKMEEEDYSTVSTKTDATKLKRNCAEKKNQSSGSEMTPAEVKVEVSQIGAKDFLLKLVCKKREGGFSRLMEAMDLLGLQVRDANVTTLHDSVLNILRVEANGYGTELEQKTLKQSLMQLAD